MLAYKVHPSWGFVLINPLWVCNPAGLMAVTISDSPEDRWTVTDCGPGSTSSCLPVCEGDRLSSFAKSRINPALRFSSSCMFPNAATFCVFRVGSARGSTHRTSCSGNFRKQSFFFLLQKRGEGGSRSDDRAQLWRHGENATAPPNQALWCAERLQQQSSARSCWGC